MKFENTRVFNFEGALRGMRNPLNSWENSDSKFGIVNIDYCTESSEIADYWVAATRPDLVWPESFTNEGCVLCDKYCDKLEKNGIIMNDDSENIAEIIFIGPNDLSLAQKLIKAGPEHRKFLRQIFVSVDITAPMYFWSELDTYKIATVANSTSKMHKLAGTQITLDCFETDDFNSELVYFDFISPDGITKVSNDIGMFSDLIIEQLEYLRKRYLETKDKRYWKELVRWLPVGWLQKRTWTTNYETIRAICSPGQRRFHKLNEWSGQDNPECMNFIKWARTLPYAQYLIFDDENVPFQIEK